MEGWQQLVALFLLPPGLLIATAILGFVLYLKWKWLGAMVIGLSIAVLAAISLPLTSRQLTAALEASSPPLYEDAFDEVRQQAKAIVVLGAGRYAQAPEYGSDTVSRFALERVRYAAYLQRRTGLPILISGGAPGGERVSEAELMRKVLQRDFKITPRWLETRSRNTMENAILVNHLLKRRGIDQVLLVTHAWHMPRALWAFREAGLQVIAAPMGFNTLGKRERSIYGYLPTAGGLYWSSVALRERLGAAWYKIVYAPEKLPAIARELERPAG
ncbi:MAG: YdcF family protein [Acidiferrobacterales bacterium]